MNIVIDGGRSLGGIIGEVGFLGVPKMGRQIICPVTELNGDNLMHDPKAGEVSGTYDIGMEDASSPLDGAFGTSSCAP
jgi:hypothetical protein